MSTVKKQAKPPMERVGVREERVGRYLRDVTAMSADEHQRLLVKLTRTESAIEDLERYAAAIRTVLDLPLLAPYGGNIDRSLQAKLMRKVSPKAEAK